MSSIQARKDEIAAKKAKLADLKRQRELREREFTTTRQSLGATTEPASTLPGRSSNRAELDDLVSSLIDRPSSEIRLDTPEPQSDRLVSRGGTRDAPVSVATQTLSYAPLSTVYSTASAASVRPEYVTYSKGVQTTETGTSPPLHGHRRSGSSEESPTRTRKRLSRREREQDEEVRQELRAEIEAEIKALQLQEQQEREVSNTASEDQPPEALTAEELLAVTHSEDFVSFLDRSSKVIERALEEDYDVLADYSVGDTNGNIDQDGPLSKSRRIREVCQFRDDDTLARRMVSDVDYSSKFPELLLASYTKESKSASSSPGLALIWNAHMTCRPEYTFTATSDILCARFSPFHPNLVLGGTYSGQVCLWDTRQRSKDGSPVQRTPLAGERGGHAHPVYGLAVVGTQHANNIVSLSTDGTSCAWSFDMLSKPLEQLQLTSPPGTTKANHSTEPVAPTCLSFSKSDQSYYLAGTEEGSLINVQRYLRAGAHAGIDQRIVYRGHSAPVTGIDFHPSRGKVDVADLALSCGLDWSVKLWKTRPQSSGMISSTTAMQNGGVRTEEALVDIARDEAVYDVKWSPVRAGVFGCVDGAGRLDVFDLNTDLEVPVCSAQPSHTVDDMLARKSLNRLAWERTQGRRVAVGGLDGVVSVFDVGTQLGGAEGLDATDEWMGVKKLVSRLDDGS